MRQRTASGSQLGPELLQPGLVRPLPARQHDLSHGRTQSFGEPGRRQLNDTADATGPKMIVNDDESQGLHLVTGEPYGRDFPVCFRSV